MKRNDWAEGKTKEVSLCVSCQQKLMPYNQSDQDESRCKACLSLKISQEIEKERHEAHQERAYLRHLEDPSRSPEENWELSEEGNFIGFSQIVDLGDIHLVGGVPGSGR